MNKNDCIALSSRGDLKDYVHLLVNFTHGNLSRVDECRKEVCGALWGTGNPDISGIGLTIGYLLESAICACLVLFLTYLRMKGMSSNSSISNVSRRMVANSARTFYDNAVFFCFAIQIASMVTLTREFLGGSSEGMGGLTVEIAWLVSSLTLLPLLPLVLRPEMFLETEVVGETASWLFGRRCQSNSTGWDEGGHRMLTEPREVKRFLAIVMCWFMGFFPFVNRMIGTFGESDVGDTPNAVISMAGAVAIEAVCFQDIPRLSLNEDNLTTAFGIISYFLMSAVILPKLIPKRISKIISRILAPFLSTSTIDKGNGSISSWLGRCGLRLQENGYYGSYARTLADFIVTTTLVIQFWAFFRIRKMQSRMVEAAGESFDDEKWTFGQIAAVMVFTPVAVEALFIWWNRSHYLDLRK